MLSQAYITVAAINRYVPDYYCHRQPIVKMVPIYWPGYDKHVRTNGIADA